MQQSMSVKLPILSACLEAFLEGADLPCMQLMPVG